MEEYSCKTAVGFFIFNRLDTTKIVFEEIRKAKPNKLYLISDGPRDNKYGEKENVLKVRDYIEKNIDWECSVYKNYADKNLGCKDRMASGISWIFDNEEMAIIIEDDVKPSPDFFPFMESMLLHYKDNTKIMAVSGFKILSDFQINYTCTFSRYPMIWGWGTWRRAWKKYDINIKSWSENKKKKVFQKYFNFWGYLKAANDFDCVYKQQKDTWDHQWLYCLLENDGLAIIPKYNLIENLGFGREDATHTTGSTEQDFTVFELPKPYSFPPVVEADEKYDMAYLNNGWGWKAMAKKMLKRVQKKEGC